MRKPTIDIIAAAMLKHADGTRAQTADEKLGVSEPEVSDRYIAAATAEIYQALKDQQESA